MSNTDTRESDMITLRLPATFLQDHLNRFLGEGAWADFDHVTIRWTSKGARVALTQAQVDALLQDAEYYAEPDMYRELGGAYFGLVRSAVATVAALNKAAA